MIINIIEIGCYNRYNCLDLYMDSITDRIRAAVLKFLSPLNLEETYKIIVDEAMKLVGADYGSILMVEGQEMTRVYASAPFFYKVQPSKRNLMYRALKTQKPVILDDKHITRKLNETGKVKIRSDVFLPLSNRNKPLGILTIMSLKKQHFSEERMNILKLFIPIAVLAIRKAQLYDENSKAIAARDLFISMAAHELRTPMTTVSGYAQLLYSKLAKGNTPESRWIEELTWESYRLNLLVNELLEVDRIKTGHFRYIWRECSLKVIINHALKDFRFIRPENKIAFKSRIANGQDKVVGDYHKLLQVIINLLDNAAKFSPPSKEITIFLKNRHGYVILQIKDQGAGIPKQDLPQIYQMFFRGHTHSREGMGVGLFLAKNIITHHHGTIRIKSKENIGTTVEIKLPER